jgi:hypothetical protein
LRKKEKGKEKGVEKEAGYIYRGDCGLSLLPIMGKHSVAGIAGNSESIVPFGPTPQHYPAFSAYSAKFRLRWTVNGH